MFKVVRKKDGSPVWFDPDRLNKWAEWAAGLGVEWSSIVLDATRKCYDGCTTTDLHNAMIAACVERETTPYLKMANRLYIGAMYKEIYGDWRKIPTVHEMYVKMTSLGLWEKMDYSVEELYLAETFIRHDRDLNATLTETKQCIDKYAISDRVAGKVYETPQFVYMRMALGNMKAMPKDRRMEDVKHLYNFLSTKKINPPSPFSLNLGTPKRQYASCCVITTLDSAPSLAIADYIAYIMTCASAGIGSHIKTRSFGDKVRGGAIKHQGKLPYYRVQQAAVTANLQASRGGANTMHFNVLDPEFFDLVRLKNVQTLPEKRVKDIDYSMGYNSEFARRVARNKKWMLVSYGDAPGLWDAFYSGDIEKFKEVYAIVEKDPSIPKKFVSARQMALEFLTNAVETGRLYEHNVEEMNRHTPFMDTIHSSNLCVAPETQVFTSTGYKSIKDIAGTRVEVWNGYEYSAVDIVKTGTNQKLVRVVTDSGFELSCTPYHKFYVKNSYKDESIEVRACDLKPGDKLIKLNTPVVQGTLELEQAYANGFYTGDGCYAEGRARVYLYGEKRNLLKYFENIQGLTEQEDRTYFYVAGLKDKFFVPTADYSVRSRLDWLAGLLDADGCLTNNAGAQAIQITSVNPTFIRQLQRLLQTLGVQSKIKLAKESGMQSMPDGKGGSKEYLCQTAEWLMFGEAGLQQLLALGLKTNRLNPCVRSPQREASQFIKVVNVLDEGRYDDTYCFNEPLRHMGVFNGLLTGQCQEIGLPSKGYATMTDLVQEGVNVEGKGEIGLCSLAAIAAGLVTEEEYELVAYYAALMIDNVIDIMEYPFPNLKATAQARRSIGVGITNLAYDMAKRGLKYSSVEGKRHIARLSELHSYSLHKAAVRLAKERGICAWAHKTKYAEGWLPIDTANRTALDKIGYHLEQDWESLREEVEALKGLRFSVLEAHMPCESSSVAGGHTNGLYPIRDYKVIKTSGTNKNLFIAPELDTLKDSYEMAWDVPTIDMIDVYAVCQCFTGQAISADLYIKYGPGERKLSAKKLLEEWLYRVKAGMKTRYYINSATGIEEEKTKEEEGPACDSCSL